LSPGIWGGFPRDRIFAFKDRLDGFGEYDDFLNFGATSLHDGHIILATGSGSTVAQITSEANHPGIVRFTLDGDAANDEVVLQKGAGLDVGPYQFAGTDFAFEAYVRANAYAIVANKLSWFAGMATGGTAGAGITDLLFTDSSGALYGTNSFVGFQKLYGESTALDGMYQKTGQTKVDGAVNTDLDTIHTLVAAGWVKVGLLYKAYPKRLGWWVNGAEVASISASALDAVAFPDDVFLQPTIGCKDVAGSSTDMTLDVDWWAFAQA
jgi:hypothetical protein